MYYTTKKANGDAGEYFFAYKIASALKWPCRLPGIDIGIDAQIEVMNDDPSDTNGKTSTGQFIAFQVKARSEEERNCVYVNPKHIEYWQGLKTPVYVVLVDLSKSKMYLHYVDPTVTYPVTQKGQARIAFNLTDDVFSANTVDDFREKAGQSASIHIDERLEAIHDGVKDIKKFIASLDTGPDADNILYLIDSRFELQQKLNEAKSLSKALNLRKDEVKRAESALYKSLYALQNVVAEYRLTDGSWGEFTGELVTFSKEDLKVLFKKST